MTLLENVIELFTIFVILGVSLTYILLSVMANWDIVPWYFLIAYIPVALFGGLSVLLLASTCYITDIIDDKERAWHFAFLQALISLGLLIGLLSGSAIFGACGYTAVFSVATVLCILATLYILLFVPETVQSQTSVGVSKRSLSQVNLKEVDAQPNLQLETRLLEDELE